MTRRRTYQVHPTVRCNLRCLHCYSSSGPERATTLPPEMVVRSIEAAANEGFDALAVSGGEPLMYRHLPVVLDAAGRLGMLRSVTTNGTLVCAATVSMLRTRIEFVALSLDGFREAHDRLRGRAGVFAAVDRATALLAGAGIRFGVIYTLTRGNVRQIPDVVAWAADRGASLLQIHPLEAAGRGAETVPELEPDTRDAAIAYLLAASSRDQRLEIHFDMADREHLEDPGVISHEHPRRPLLADLVSPLVLEEDGVVVPLQHGFPRSFAVGSIRDGDLSALALEWTARTFPRFRALRGELARRAAGETTALPFFNWYQAMALAAAASPEDPDRLVAR